LVNPKIAQGTRRPVVHLPADKCPSQEQEKLMPHNLSFTTISMGLSQNGLVYCRQRFGNFFPGEMLPRPLASLSAQILLPGFINQ
jgi:hypothetical protein